MNDVKKHFTIPTLFGETFNLYFQNFLALIIPTLIFFGAASVIFFLSYYEFFTSGFSVEEFSNLTPFRFLIYISLGLLFLPYNYYQIKITSNSYLNRNEAPSAILNRGFRKLLPQLGMYILYMLGLMAAALAFVIPFYILSIGWCLYYVVYVLEEKTPRASLKRSWILMKGHKGKLFLIFILLIILMYALMIITMLLGMGSLTALVSLLSENTESSYIGQLTMGITVIYVLIYTLIIPLITAFIVIVYYNILKDKEGFATEQLAEEFMP